MTETPADVLLLTVRELRAVAAFDYLKAISGDGAYRLGARGRLFKALKRAGMSEQLARETAQRLLYDEPRPKRPPSAAKSKGA
jgi:hypothetical protein